jgi:uncharacterized protein YggU (UPF0235/DUF167 family)
MADVRVRLTPRAKGRDALTGLREGVLTARVSAPPVDGRANAALCALLAAALGVPKSRVEVIRGHTAREKVVRAEGVTDADVRALVQRLGDPG